MFESASKNKPMKHTQDAIITVELDYNIRKGTEYFLSL
jgi:hypothetical protein